MNLFQNFTPFYKGTDFDGISKITAKYMHLELFKNHNLRGYEIQ